MDVSDYRILEFIYLTLEKTKLERQQMSPFQFRRLIIEALQSRQYTVRAEEVSALARRILWLFTNAFC